VVAKQQQRKEQQRQAWEGVEQGARGGPETGRDVK